MASGLKTVRLEYQVLDLAPPLNQTLNQLHNPTHAGIVQLEMLGQLRHGVGAGGKGGLNCGVAVVGVRPALDVRNQFVP